MRKFWILALKEVKVTFRDVGMLVTMLATPLVLTLAISAAFGGGGASPLSNLPVLLLDKDGGPLAQEFVDIFTQPEISELLTVTLVTDEAEARARVDADAVAALIIIPEDFTARSFPMLDAVQSQMGLDLTTLDPDEASAQLTPEQQQQIAQIYQQVTLETETSPPSVVEIYASPDRPISTGMIKGIVSQILEQMHMTGEGITVIMAHLIGSGALEGTASQSDGSMNFFSIREGDSFASGSVSELPVRLKNVSPSGRGFNWVDYSSASMAILFLMFAVTSGGRTLLAEREWGTLPRLLVSPTPALAILMGKMGGIVLTGLLQMAVLWGATSLMIDAYWGDPLAVVVAVLFLVLCATGVGAVISAWAKTPGQSGAIGTAVTLVGSALSGSFLPRAGLPIWVQRISLCTPQAWGIEIFSALQLGKGLVEILPLLGGTLLLTVIYYSVALLGFRRQFQ
jgi:ABC-2 type transport system permease protein